MLLGIISIVIGVIFYSIGATLILPFSFVEVFALATAYFYNALHANDYERLKVDSRIVYFESKYGRSFREENYLRSLTRVTGTSHPVKLFFYLLKLLIHFLALFRIFSTCR